ncbi:UbiA family prenyltransferase [Niabella sp. W65]|nr:UbiA family prenyltransferase [Niabella sp. W65]MCH7362387.1 UbiA family prenyltransferase [Niabella sp. W65]
MDIIALILSYWLGWMVLTGIGAYILASRLYSYRGVRLKRYPVTGYLTVIICQGALVYFIVSNSVSTGISWKEAWLPAMITSLLIGGTYPLTQVYQHQQDRADGVTTLSYKLGVRGTFVFLWYSAFCSIIIANSVFYKGRSAGGSYGVYDRYVAGWFLFYPLVFTGTKEFRQCEFQEPDENELCGVCL